MKTDIIDFTIIIIAIALIFNLITDTVLIGMLLEKPKFSNNKGTYTKYLKLYKPAKGEYDWGEKVNNNFNIIDERFRSLS